ncbi:hypothetical protein M9458_050711 [Cirrhinus mrigala]|uniref:Uncharacterized protein n=1 Tax=Cirrhinus mrigala TaxID=683832 RepID=A0ABD0MXZ9_CIRMR
MSEIDLFPEDNFFETADPSAPPATVQATSAPQDPTIETASRGRRPSRTIATHTSRRRITPSPFPYRRQRPSSASSYASALSSAPATGKWTVAGLRQVLLVCSSVIMPCRSTKVDLLNLYTYLQAGDPPSSTPPSRATDKASTGRSTPYSRPEQITTPLKTGSRLSGCSRRPPAPTLLLDHPGGSSLLISAMCRPSLLPFHLHLPIAKSTAANFQSRSKIQRTTRHIFCHLPISPQET